MKMAGGEKERMGKGGGRGEGWGRERGRGRGRGREGQREGSGFFISVQQSCLYLKSLDHLHIM